MDLQAVMKQLEGLGTAQNRKVYARHGVSPNTFGVSYASLGALKKKIKTDHALAEKLWKTGNHDARILATMVADRAKTDAKLIEAWARDLDNYVLTDALSLLAAEGRVPAAKIDRWCRSKNDWTGQLGWNLVGRLALSAQETPDDYFEEKIETIEREIHARPNRTRHAMNGALIGIGVRNDGLRRRALAAARKIGRVEVDHGETGCKTPDAAEYIERAMARRKKSAAAAPGSRKRA